MRANEYINGIRFRFTLYVRPRKFNMNQKESTTDTETTKELRE